MKYGIYSMDTMQDYAVFNTLDDCKNWVEIYEKQLEDSKYIEIIDDNNHDNVIFYANIEWRDGKSNIKKIAEDIIAIK
nr:hypothetical protein [uncultured Treponema sp.]